MKVIDHRYYPHINDRIWFYLSVTGVARVRRVCKSWSIRADLSESNYFVVRATDSSKSRYEIGTRCPAHLNATEIITEEILNGCCCEDGGGEGEMADFCRFCNRLEVDGAIVDVVDMTPADLNTASPSFERLPFTAAFRWLNGFSELSNHHGRIMGASDHVFFLQHDGLITSSLTFDFDGDLSYKFLGVVELTFNFDCHSNPTTSHASISINITNWLELTVSGDLNYIFHDKRIKPLSAAPPNPTFIAGLLQRYPGAGVCVYLIGLESFADTTRSMEKLKEDLFNQFVDYHAAHSMSTISREECERLCEEDWDMVTFLTMEEYEKKVGRKRFLLNTTK